MAPGLDPAGFELAMGSVLQLMLANNGEANVFVNLHEEPIGLIATQYATVYGRRRAFPHAWWFKEGTARQRLECSLRFLLNLKKTNLIVIEATEANWLFFEHLCKYGLLRRVGTLRDAYGAGGRSAIYQGVGK